MLKNVLKTVVPLILFLFIITNTLSANEPDNKPKNIFRSKCENSTKEISLLDGFEDKSFIIEILDFGGGYISFKMTLYNNSDCKSSWLNKLEYFEIKNYILLTENLESLKSGKKINMSNSTLWTPSGKIMELRTTSEKVAKELMIPKKCSLLQNSGEPVIIDKNCMGDNEFFQFKKKKDFFPGAFLALKYDNELNRLLLFENDEGDSYNNVNRYISLFPTYADSY
ncbi:hypothetical protein N3Z17_01260 [Candidatus Bandiella numerosa]|uniref:hypothetical protein n=1 Tax=Candidatus Bandiella numerosa TaxID=2570586 RepID=UPI00249F6277|nr:hypothetical protein [Candidatus Bandiella numerosa]WHA05171.1 hypothetical protein N3Z17_01260 [Candidatus Bandiella numerosa]